MTYVIGTAGHVDHGKSTLVTALTGIDPDRLAEEKAREMTIDLGFAWLRLPGGETIGIIDVPGHRDFIENMLAGVGGIDLALFVVAADEGVMPQTREHLAILDLLEVPGGVVALTKADLVEDTDWLEMVTLDLKEAFKGTVLADAPILPVSARSGAGLDRLVDALEKALAGRPPRPDRGRPRLPVDRVFTMSGFGTVVTGTLSNGALAVGDEVEIQPGGRKARIRGLQTHRETIQKATPGSRVAVNLTGVDKDEIRRGDVIAGQGVLQGTRLIDAQFRHLADAGRPLRHNAAVKFFSGAAETMAHARLLGDRELPPGKEGWLQLRLEEPLALDRQDRFILRYPAPPQTIGGGVILDPHPPHRWRRFKPEVVSRFLTLARGSPEDWVLNLLDGVPLLNTDQIAASLNLESDVAHEAIEHLIKGRDVIALDDGWVISRSSWMHIAERIRREVRIFHMTYPMRSGMPREALRGRLELSGKGFNSLLALAVKDGLLVDEGVTVRTPDHMVRFLPSQQAAIDRLWEEIRRDPVNTLSVKDTIALVHEDVYFALIEQRRLVQVSPEVWFDEETYGGLVEKTKEFIRQNGSITVAQARDLFQSSRKYVLALLEYLDSIGVTRRVGDERVLKQGK